MDAGTVIVMITCLMLLHDIEQSLVAYSGYPENVYRFHAGIYSSSTVPGGLLVRS